MLVYMLAAHALFDYALQGDWLSKAKNPNLDLVPGEKIWPLALASHAIIHAVAVQVIAKFVTGNAAGAWMFFVVEFVAHYAIDYSKCRGRFGYNVDQYLHIGCKVVYVVPVLIFGHISGQIA